MSNKNYTCREKNSGINDGKEVDKEDVEINVTP